MTTETPDEAYVAMKARIDAYWAAHPAEAAEIEARGSAMMQRAAIYERALDEQNTAIKRLCAAGGDGFNMLMRVANLIALAQLRHAALGIGLPTWQEALQDYGVLRATTIEAIKPTFQREAMSG